MWHLSLIFYLPLLVTAFLLTAFTHADPAQLSLSSSNSMKGIHKLAFQKLGKNSLLTNGGLNDLEQIFARRTSIDQQNFNRKRLVGGKRSYKQNISNYNDLFYGSKISIGTPPQEFTVLLNTGTEITWVADKSCVNRQKCDWFCYFEQNLCNTYCEDYCCREDPKEKTSTCEKKNKFDQSKSKTYKETIIGFGIQSIFGIKFVDGFFGNDTIRLGGSRDVGALSLPYQSFGQVTKMDKRIRNVPIDGVLGLASYRGTLIFDAIEKGLLAKPMFTVFLGTEKGNNGRNGAGGMVTYGGMDDENCKPVQGWTEMSPEYGFELQGISYGNKYKMVKKQGASSALGTSLIIGDPKVVKNLANYVGARYDSQRGLYLIDCDADYEPISFTISGKNYSLTKEVLTLNLPTDQPLREDNVSEKTCLFGIKPHYFDPNFFGNFKWILGDPFIRQYCHIHDIGNKRLGFAPSIQPKQKECDTENYEFSLNIHPNNLPTSTTEWIHENEWLFEVERPKGNEYKLSLILMTLNYNKHISWKISFWYFIGNWEQKIIKEFPLEKYNESEIVKSTWDSQGIMPPDVRLHATISSCTPI